jgi:DNA-binding transcriptional LysR family regulator
MTSGECVLPLVLKRFAETHPGVTVDVVIDQSSNLRKRLDERRLDVTLINLSHTVPSKGDIEVLLDEELVWGWSQMRHRLSP